MNELPDTAEAMEAKETADTVPLGWLDPLLRAHRLGRLVPRRRLHPRGPPAGRRPGPAAAVGGRRRRRGQRDEHLRHHPLHGARRPRPPSCSWCGASRRKAGGAVGRDRRAIPVPRTTSSTWPSGSSSAPRSIGGGRPLLLAEAEDRASRRRSTRCSMTTSSESIAAGGGGRRAGPQAALFVGLPFRARAGRERAALRRAHAARCTSSGDALHGRVLRPPARHARRRPSSSVLVTLVGAGLVRLELPADRARATSPRPLAAERARKQPPAREARARLGAVAAVSLAVLGGHALGFVPPGEFLSASPPARSGRCSAGAGRLLAVVLLPRPGPRAGPLLRGGLPVREAAGRARSTGHAGGGLRRAARRRAASTAAPACRVCSTGIDIRDGAAGGSASPAPPCIDACEPIMRKQAARRTLGRTTSAASRARRRAAARPAVLVLGVLCRARRGRDRGRGGARATSTLDMVALQSPRLPAAARRVTDGW